MNEHLTPEEDSTPVASVIMVYFRKNGEMPSYDLTFSQEGCKNRLNFKYCVAHIGL